MGPGRRGQGAPGLEAGRSRRCRTPHHHPPALPSAGRRERGDLVAEQSLLPMGGEAPPVLWLLLYLWIQSSSYYLYLTFTVKALLSPAS